MAEVFILLLGIQGDERFSRLTQRHEQELQKVGLTLSRVTQDEDIAVGLVIASAVEVHKDIGSVSVLADIEAVGIGLTGVVKRIQVRHGGRGKHSFKERCECVISARHTGFEAFLLTESQTVYRDALSCQLHIDLGLNLLQLIQGCCRQLNEHRAMQKRFLVLTKLGEERYHVLHVTFGGYRFLNVIGGGEHSIFSRCVLEDLTLLYVIHVAGIDVEGYVFLVTEVAKDCLITGLRRIFTDSPHRAIGVAADKMIGVEFYSRGRDHVKEILDTSLRLTYLYRYLLFLFSHCHFPFLHGLLVHIEVGFFGLQADDTAVKQIHL